MDTTEQDAIRAVLTGDRDAYRVLMERHYRSVQRIAYRITGDETDAEEATQEAFLRAYRKLPSFRGEAGFGTWVTRIAMNAALTLAERRQREKILRPRAEEGDTGENELERIVDRRANPERLLLDRETEQLRREAMETLTAMERAAFMMRHMEDVPMAEIATALQISVNSAKQAVFRAVSKLRSTLAPVAGGVR